MTNRRGSILFFFSFSLLAIKLAVIGHHQYLVLREIYPPDDITANLLWFNMWMYGMFIEPILISISLLGYLIKRQLGYLMATIFPYYLAIAMLSHISPSQPYLLGLNWPQLSFVFLVLVPLNISGTVNIFFKEPKLLQRLILNSLAIFISLTFYVSLECYIDYMNNS